MSTVIYCIKLCLCENIIKKYYLKSILNHAQALKIVYFLTLIYIHWWFKDNRAYDCSINDLQLINDINK